MPLVIVQHGYLEGQTPTKEQAKGNQHKSGGDQPSQGGDWVLPPGFDFGHQKDPETFHRYACLSTRWR